MAGLPLRFLRLQVGTVGAALALIAVLGARTPPTISAPAPTETGRPPLFAKTGPDQARGAPALEDPPTPPEATVLFDGTDAGEWRTTDGTEPGRWPIVDGALVVCAGRGDIQTIREFEDFRLHVEFRSPEIAGATTEQGRGNSGMYLQGRYELQVLDSFGRDLAGRDDVGAIYGVKDADTNASRPAETWQAYDVTFRAARWSGETKTENARVTVLLNGTLIHQDVEIPGSTGGGSPESAARGPIRLQDHGDPVRYRNIWIQPLS